MGIKAANFDDKSDLTEEENILQISLKQKRYNCPRGKAETNHDDRFKTVRGLSIRGKPLKLRYRRRRYFCPTCGKRGSEDDSFLDRYQHLKPNALPRALSFDEFKGNANGESFQCILTAPEERHILDILPDRRVSTLSVV